MARMINNNRISCDACLSACPKQALFEKHSDAKAGGYQVRQGQGSDGTVYVISGDRCTECVGHCEEPQCASVCPIGIAVPRCASDPVYPASKETLLSRARRLHPHKEIRHEMAWSERLAGRQSVQFPIHDWIEVCRFTKDWISLMAISRPPNEARFMRETDLPREDLWRQRWNQRPKK